MDEALWNVVTDKVDSTCKVVEDYGRLAPHNVGALHHLARTLRGGGVVDLRKCGIELHFRYHQLHELVRTFCLQQRALFFSKSPSETSIAVCEDALNVAGAQLIAVDPAFPYRAWVDADRIHPAVVLLVIERLVQQCGEVSSFLIRGALESSLDHFHSTVVMDARKNIHHSDEQSSAICGTAEQPSDVKRYFKRLLSSRIAAAGSSVIHGLNRHVSHSTILSEEPRTPCHTPHLAPPDHSDGTPHSSNHSSIPARIHGSVTVRPVSAGATRWIPIVKKVTPSSALINRRCVIQSVTEQLEEVYNAIDKLPKREQRLAVRPTTRKGVIDVLQQTAYFERDSLRQLHRHQEVFQLAVTKAEAHLTCIDVSRHSSPATTSKRSISTPPVLLASSQTPSRKQNKFEHTLQRLPSSSPPATINRISAHSIPRTRLDGSNIIPPTPNAIEQSLSQHPGSHYPIGNNSAHLSSTILRTRAIAAQRLSTRLAEQHRSTHTGTRNTHTHLRPHLSTL
jgi:hypothetical protein